MRLLGRDRHGFFGAILRVHGDHLTESVLINHDNRAAVDRDNVIHPMFPLEACLTASTFPVYRSSYRAARADVSGCGLAWVNHAAITAGARGISRTETEGRCAEEAASI